MREARITHPRNEPLIMIREWQLDALNGNQCAAALLSLLEYWHNHKAAIAEQDRAIGKKGSILQWHTVEELESGILNLYKRDSIRKALLLLEEKGFIRIKVNPVYGFDRTKFFVFNEEYTQTYIDDYIRRKSNRIIISEKSSSISEKSSSISEKSSLQRLHTETTIRKEGDYSFPSQTKFDSPLNCDSAHAIESSQISIRETETTPGVASIASVPIENTLYPFVQDGGDNHAAQSDLDFAAGLPVAAILPFSNGKPATPQVSEQGSPVSGKKRGISGKASGKNQPKAETDPRATHPAITAIRDLRCSFPPKATWDKLIEKIGDTVDRLKLESCWVEWLMRGFNKNSLSWVDWYLQGIPEQNYGKQQKKKGLDSKYGTWVQEARNAKF